MCEKSYQVTHQPLLGYAAKGLKWVIDGLPVQGYNLPNLGLITFGENWHGNHHAFPESALLGVEAHQSDPGFALVRLLQRPGFAWDVNLPESCDERIGLRLVG